MEIGRTEVDPEMTLLRRFLVPAGHGARFLISSRSCATSGTNGAKEREKCFTIIQGLGRKIDNKKKRLVT